MYALPCGQKHYNFGLLAGQLLFNFNLVHLILQVRAARGLLSAVTRLLILADIIDVNLMLKKLQQVENDLENLKNANSQAELMDSMGRFTHSAQELMAQAAKRSVNLTYTYWLYIVTINRNGTSDLVIMFGVKYHYDI